MPRLDPETGLKICGHCKISKPANAYTKDKNRPDKLHSYCRECNSTVCTQWRRANPEYQAKWEAENPDWDAQWREANPEKVLIHRCKERSRDKGVPCELTVEDIHIPDNCPICQRPLTRNIGKVGSSSPTTDRWNPVLGYVRGNIWIICHRCNSRKQDMSGEDHIAFGIKLIDSFKEECERVSQLSSQG